MSPLPPNSPCGLPSSPRAIRHNLPAINTNVRPTTSPTRYTDKTPEKQTPQIFVDTRQRNRDSLIFVNATIPLSPVSTSSSTMDYKEQPFTGLAPRRRNGLARLFCCFGREERARRRVMRDVEYEKVGEKCHWTEL